MLADRAKVFDEFAEPAATQPGLRRLGLRRQAAAPQEVDPDTEKTDEMLIAPLAAPSREVPLSEAVLGGQTGDYVYERSGSLFLVRPWDRGMKGSFLTPSRREGYLEIQQFHALAAKDTTVLDRDWVCLGLLTRSPHSA